MRGRSLVIGLLPALALVACVACSAARKGPAPRAASAAEVMPTTADGWQRYLARQVRQGNDAQALVAARGLRRLGSPSADSLAYEAIALARLGRADAARKVAARVMQAATSPNNDDAWQAVERLIAWYARAHHRPAAAWTLLAPHRTPACNSARSCDLHARLLVHWAELTAPMLVAKLAAARPRTGPRAGALWQAGITRALIDRQRWPLVDAAIADSLAQWPGAAETWATWMYAARRRRGPSHRTAWAKALRGAHLSVPQLRAIAAVPEVEADPLLVVGVWRLILEAKGALTADRLAYLRLLIRNHLRGLSSTNRDELERISVGFSGGVEERLLLVEGLLVAGAHNVGASLLVGQPVSPRATALQAEIARQKGELVEARALAKSAVAAADGKSVTKGAVALLLARLWRVSLPKDAAVWRDEAARDRGDGSVATASGRVTATLLLGRIKPGSAQVLVDYADALNTALRAGGPARVDAVRRRRIFVLAMLRKGRHWGLAIRPSLSVLGRSPHADTETLLALAQVSYQHGRVDAGLTAWRRATAVARATGAELDAEAFLRFLATTAQPQALARWLDETGLHSVDDIALSWRVARRLLFGPDKLLGRRWLANALARTAGTGTIGERLPSLKRVRTVSDSRAPALSDTELRRIASSGAADLRASSAS